MKFEHHSTTIPRHPNLFLIECNFPFSEVYEDRNVTRLRFKKYMQVRRAATKMAKKMVGKHRQRTLIFMGAWREAANSPIKGQIRTPRAIFEQKLRVYADVLPVDEHRTTKLCSDCHEPVYTSRSPYRFQFCQNCRKYWNRDVNAGRNIFQKGMAMIDDELPAHPNFERGVQLNQPIDFHVANQGPHRHR